MGSDPWKALMNRPMINAKQGRGRPRSLKQGHRVVGVSLDPTDLEWIDSAVQRLKLSGTIGEGPTRSSIIRLAVRRMVEEFEGLDLEVLLGRFGVGRVETPDPKRIKGS
jgi:hypothetical protein